MKTIYKFILSLALCGHASAQLNAGGSPLTDPQKATMRSSLGLGTAATGTLSTTGGAGNVAQFDANGNLTLRPLRPLADAGGIVADGGNLILTDRQQIGWYASDSSDGYGPTGSGKFLFRIRQDNGHPYETNFDASGSICFYWGESTAYRGMQFGNAQGGSHFMYRSSGDASAGTTMRQSVPDAYNTSTWNGSTAVRNRLAIQAAPLDLSGTNSAFHFYRNNTLGSAQAADGVLFATIAPEGVWSAGTAPDFTTLTASSDIFTQTCSKYRTSQNAKFTLGATNTLAISGALAGMRGIIYVTQDSTGGRLLTLPDGASTATTWALSTTAGTTDRLMWEYDGSYYFFSMTKGFELPLDADASAFIARHGTTDATEKAAVNTFVRSLKSASLWTKFYAIYPFIGSTGTAQSKNLISDTYNITWSGTGHTFASASGVTGAVGTSAYGNTGINFSTLSTLNNASGYVYVRTAAPTEAGYFFGATDGVGRFGIKPSTTYNYIEGPMNNGGGIVASLATFKGHHAVSRSSSTDYLTIHSGTFATASVASTAGPNQPVYLLARNNTDSPAGYSNVNLGMAAFGNSLTSGEWATFETIVTAYQTALGRQN